MNIVALLDTSYLCLMMRRIFVYITYSFVLFINPFKFEIMSIHMIRLKECFTTPYFDLTCD